MFSSSLLVVGLISITQGLTDSVAEDKKILAGTTVTQVLLRENRFNTSICGGALFHPYYVITASQCVLHYHPHQLSVFFDTPLYDEKYNYTIQKIIIHPYYEYTSGMHDIALIKLSSPVPKGSGILYGIIPKPDENIMNERPVTVVSFGKRLIFNQVQLLHNKLNIVSWRICKSEYERFGFLITQNYVCARNASLGSCIGSVGFPLVDMQNRFIGIATFPFRCGPLPKSNLPSVYIWLSSYFYWIYWTVFLNTPTTYHQ